MRHRLAVKLIVALLCWRGLAPNPQLPMPVLTSVYALTTILASYALLFTIQENHVSAADLLSPDCPALYSWCSAIHGSPRQADQQRRRQGLLAAAWHCQKRRNVANTSSAPALRVLVWDSYAPWLLPALGRFADLYGIEIDPDVQPLDKLVPAMCGDGVSLLEGGPSEPYQDHEAKNWPDGARRQPDEGRPSSGPPGAVTARGADSEPVGSTAAPHALWLYASAETQQLAQDNRLEDLGSLLESPHANSNLDWLDVRRPYRLQLAPYNGRTVAVPLDGDLLYMFYRKDVLGGSGSPQVPLTWTQLVEFAAMYDKLDKNASATALWPPYPICIPRGVGCRQDSYVQAVWSSIAQTNGSSQPIHFNVTTFKPSIDSAATTAAFRILAQLLAASAPPDPDDECNHGSLAFAKGRCAIALAGFVPQVQLLYRPEASVLQTARVAALPGSELVSERGDGETAEAAGELFPCTPTTCPFATRLLIAATGYMSGYDSAAGQPEKEVFVNHAPQAPLSLLVGGINSRASPLAKLVAFELLSYLSSARRFSADEPAQPIEHVFPVRGTLVQPGGIGTWLAGGYDRELVQDAAQLLYDTLLHPNLAWGLRMPGQVAYNQLLGSIVSGLGAGNISADPWFVVSPPNRANGSNSAGGTAPERPRTAAEVIPLVKALADAKAKLSDVYSQGGAAGCLYVASLRPWAPVAGSATPWGCSKAPPGQPGFIVGRPSLSQQQQQQHSRRPVLVPVLLGTLLPLMLAVTGCLVWRLHRSSVGGPVCWLYRSHVGCLRVPGGVSRKRKMHVPAAGAEVVLCVTDIQDSTTLWESLPADVIAKAVDIHHRCVRTLALRHGGYESATEGDSFILAFDCVWAAVAFALELQSDLLLEAPWPPQLLELEVCKPVYTLLPPSYPFNHTVAGNLSTAASPLARRVPWVAAAYGSVDGVLRRAVTSDSCSGVAAPLATKGDQPGTAACGSGDSRVERPRAAASSPFPSYMRHSSTGNGHQQQQPAPVSAPLACYRLVGGPIVRGRSLEDLTSPSAPLHGVHATSGITIGCSLHPAADTSSILPAGEGGGGEISISTDIAQSNGPWCQESAPSPCVAAVNCAAVHQTAGGQSYNSWTMGGRNSNTCRRLGAVDSSLLLASSRLACRTVAAAALTGGGSASDYLVGPNPVLSAPEIRGDSEPLPSLNDSGMLTAGGFTVYAETAYGITDAGAGGGRAGAAGTLSVTATSRLWDEGEGGGTSSASNVISVPAFRDSPAEPPVMATAGPPSGAAVGTSGEAGGSRTLQEVLRSEAAKSAHADALQMPAQSLDHATHHQQQQHHQHHQQHLMFRGLRVRAGISVAVPTPAEVQYNAAAARVVYGGLSVSACKALADQAHGGQVFLSARAQQVLATECSGLGGKPPGTMLLQIGILEHPAPSLRTKCVTPAGCVTPLRGHSSGLDPDPSKATMVAESGLDRQSLALSSWKDVPLPNPLPRLSEHPPGAFTSAPSVTQHGNQQAPPQQARSQHQVYHHELQYAKQALGLERVFLVTTPALSQRLALVPPPRFSPSAPAVQNVYSAPLGRISYAVVRVPSAAALLGWNAPVAVESMRLFVSTAISELQRTQGGYLVSASPAEVRAAFPSPAVAVAWALHLRGALLRAAWPPELLQHKLGEPVDAFDGAPDGAGSQPASETGTPRLRWPSLGAGFRVSSREASMHRQGGGGAGGGRGRVAAGVGSAAGPWAAPESAAGLESVMSRALHHQRFRRITLPRRSSLPGVTHAELPLSAMESHDGDEDKLEPLGRLEASTPLRRYRHSIDAFHPMTTTGACIGALVGDGLGKAEPDIDCTAAARRRSLALAQLATHFSSSGMAAQRGGAPRGVRTGGSASASGYLTPVPTTTDVRRTSVAATGGGNDLPRSAPLSPRPISPADGTVEQPQRLAHILSQHLALPVTVATGAVPLRQVAVHTDGVRYGRTCRGTTASALFDGPSSLQSNADDLDSGCSTRRSVGERAMKAPMAAVTSPTIPAVAPAAATVFAGRGCSTPSSGGTALPSGAGAGHRGFMPDYSPNGPSSRLLLCTTPDSEVPRGQTEVESEDQSSLLVVDSNCLEIMDTLAAWEGDEEDSIRGPRGGHGCVEAGGEGRDGRVAGPTAPRCAEHGGALNASSSAPMPALLPSPSPVQPGLTSRGRLILRGLRISAAVTTGSVDWSVSSKTYALTYSGRAVGRALRLLEVASSGKVLCDQATHTGVVHAQRRFAPGLGAPSSTAAAAAAATNSRRRASLSAASTPVGVGAGPAGGGGATPVAPGLHSLTSAPVGPYSLNSSPEGPAMVMTVGSSTVGVNGVRGFEAAPERSVQVTERAALDVRLVRLLPPVGHNRLTVRAAEAAFVCELASEAPAVAPLSVTLSAAPQRAAARMPYFRPSVVRPTTGAPGWAHAQLSSASVPVAPQPSSTYLIDCGSGDATTAADPEQTTTPLPGRPPWLFPQQYKGVQGASDSGVEAPPSRPRLRKPRIGSCPGLDLLEDDGSHVGLRLDTAAASSFVQLRGGAAAGPQRGPDGGSGGQQQYSMQQWALLQPHHHHHHLNPHSQHHQHQHQRNGACSSLSVGASECCASSFLSPSSCTTSSAPLVPAASAAARLSPGQRFRSSAATTDPYMPYIVCERVDEEGEGSDCCSVGEVGSAAVGCAECVSGGGGVRGCGDGDVRLPSALHLNDTVEPFSVSAVHTFGRDGRRGDGLPWETTVGLWPRVVTGHCEAALTSSGEQGGPTAPAPGGDDTGKYGEGLGEAADAQLALAITEETSRDEEQGVEEEKHDGVTAASGRQQQQPRHRHQQWQGASPPGDATGAGNKHGFCLSGSTTLPGHGAGGSLLHGTFRAPMAEVGGNTHATVEGEFDVLQCHHRWIGPSCGTDSGAGRLAFFQARHSQTQLPKASHAEAVVTKSPPLPPSSAMPQRPVSLALLLTRGSSGRRVGSTSHYTSDSSGGGLFNPPTFAAMAQLSGSQALLSSSAGSSFRLAPFGAAPDGVVD